MKKEDFYNAFARLHCGRLNNYLENQASLDRLLNRFIYVNTDNLFNDIFCGVSKNNCENIDAFLDCDLYSSEIIHMYFENGELMLVFTISINQDRFDSLSFNFRLNHHSELCAIEEEWLDFNGPEYKAWELLASELEAEFTFGSLKRIPVAGAR